VLRKIFGPKWEENGFEVLTAVITKMTVFWVVAPCSLVEVTQRFRGPCCLHHQGATTQKTAIFWEEFTRGCRKLHSEYIHNLSSQNIRLIKPRMTILAGHVSQKEKLRNSYKTFF
jgi:hypothetical protein